MKFWRNRRAIFTIVFITILAVFVFAIERAAAPEIESVQGGSYAGNLSVWGKVQLDVFQEGSELDGWLYQEGSNTFSAWITMASNSPGVFTAKIFDRNNHETNATLNFRFGNSGETVQGRISTGTNSNSSTELFTLRRVAAHGAISQRSRAMMGRFGAHTRFFGQFPLIDTNSPFHTALSHKLAEEVNAEGRRFTSGNLERHWEILKNGDVLFEGANNPEWQPRLLTDSLASFAEYSEPYYGGCGDFSMWTGRNYIWHEGRLQKLDLVDLFRPDLEWEVEIRRICKDELWKQGWKTPAREVDSDIDINAFTLSSTGLQIYFDSDTMGGYEGAFIVHIPYSQLRNYFKLSWPATALPIFAQERENNATLVRNNNAPFR